MDDIVDGALAINQGKTGKRLRIAVTGQLADLTARIQVSKAAHKTEHAQIPMVRDGKPMTKQIGKDHFAAAKEVAAARPELASAIKKFWLHALRAKAADETSTQRVEQAASDLLGHESPVPPSNTPCDVRLPIAVENTAFRSQPTTYHC